MNRFRSFFRFPIRFTFRFLAKSFALLIQHPVDLSDRAAMQQALKRIVEDQDITQGGEENGRTRAY